LLRGKIENGCPILCSDVRSLAVELSRIVVAPEYCEEILVADLGGIELDLDGFGVAGGIGADLLVGGVLRSAPRIADIGPDDTFPLPERSLDTPEAACGKYGFLGHLVTSPAAARASLSGQGRGNSLSLHREKSSVAGRHPLCTR